MRKIWSSRNKDKEKRRSITGSSPLMSKPSLNSQTPRDSAEFDSYSVNGNASISGASHMTGDTRLDGKNGEDGPDDATLGRSIPESNVTKTTTNTLASESNTTLSHKSSHGHAIKGPKSVPGLIKYDYDTKLVKNAWANVIINTNSVTEISDQTLRMFRVELRGSHLYLYRQPNLGYKNIKVSPGEGSKDDLQSLMGANTTTASSVKNMNVHDIDSASISGPMSVTGPNISGPLSAGPSGSFPKPPSINTNISSSYDNNTVSPLQPPEMFKNSNNSNGSLVDSHTLNSGSTPQFNGISSDDYDITYSEIIIPHPQLKFDFESASFLPGSSMESIIHFIFFQYDPTYSSAIEQALAILPVFPDLGKTLRLMGLYLSHLFNHKFTGEYKLSTIVERLLYFLNNLHENFKGFLLKSDIAPYILKILEQLNEYLTPELVDNNIINDIKSFKSKMLSSQQNLINLIADNEKLHDLNPFQDLNANYFLNHVNLIEFASTISAIDLKFFNEWNSNIDKSLLLYSSINECGSTDFFYKKNPLFFNNEFHIHYLSRLLINHLFCETSLTSLNCSTSLLEFKARLLEKWIDLGCLLDKSGNMSSWLGIVSIVLSQPILRLTKIWSFVSPDYIKLSKNDWSPVLFELDRRFLVNGVNGSGVSSPNPQNSPEENGSLDQRDSYHIMVPRGLGKIYPKERVIPYFGDLIINNNTITSINELEAIYKRINYSFTRWNEYLTNLTNHNEIIKYNDDVLKRYDNMGFIFSNESLNQVLYLGLNNDESKPLPQTFEITNDNLLITNVNETLRNQLLKVIEINTESLNLEKLMMFSLSFEPELPESYLRPLSGINSLFRSMHSNHSNISINSNESSSSLPTNPDPNASVNSLNNNSTNEFNPSSRLPIFNNHYFKISLAKYDELTSNNGGIINIPNESSTITSNKHNIPISKNLVFRIDDFVSDLDVNNSDFNALDDVDNEDDDEDVPGLGINVDDILNSEKFNNLSVNSIEASSRGNPNSPAKNSHSMPQSNSYSVVSSESSQLQIYKYIPKYASIDRLIDLLIIDSKYLDESINIDLTEYRFVFLLNYSSFITTRELLDKLAHRFINSGNAVISIMKKLHLMKNNQLGDKTSDEFPNWNLDPTVDLNDLGEVDYSLLLKIQINILKVLVVLINNFHANFSMDLFNKRIIIKLLKLFSNEILQWYNSNKIDPNLEKPFESLVNYYKKLKKLFVKKTYRPFEVSKFDHFLINEFKFSNSLHEVPMNRNLPGHKNVNKIEKFLHKFNKLLTAFYKGIKTEDWFKVFKILEIEFEKNHLLEFNLQKTNTPEESLVISNIFNYFDSLNDPEEKVLITKKFPLVFRKLFKLYSKFKAYILVQLTDLNSTVDERLDRMKTLLYMVKICQLKMADNQFVFEGKGDIPSCIGSAITNAIYSPESRLFTNLWIKASSTLNGVDDVNFEDLNSLLPRELDSNALIINHEPLLPCFGWIIENLMDMNKAPNFNRSLINFNKRYLVFKLVKELTVEDLESSEELSHNDTREFEFLLKLDENLVNNQNIKEFTLLERDKAKLFRNILKDQHKILLLDNRKKQMKEGRDVQNNPQNNSAAAGSNLNKKPSNSSLRRQSLSYKSNTTSRFKISGLFNKSRPFSLSGNNSNPPYAEKSASVKELPDPDMFIEGKQKPLCIIPLKNKKIFPVYLLPLSFKIDGESAGDDFFFQCLDEEDLNNWLMLLNYANRHWFFSKTMNMKNQSGFTTLGIPLNVICNRQSSLVPKFLVEIFEELEKEGLKDVGIYRISTSLSELNNLRTMIDKFGTIDFQDRAYDTHALTSCVKSFFRELPDSLLTDKVIEKLFGIRQQILNDEVGYVDMISSFKDTLRSLPVVNYETLKVLMKHLQKVSQHSEVNKMTPANIATVIGPALTEASNLNILVNNFGFMNFIIEKMIVYYDHIIEKPIEEVAKEQEETVEPEADETIDQADQADQTLEPGSVPEPAPETAPASVDEANANQTDTDQPSAQSGEGSPDTPADEPQPEPKSLDTHKSPEPTEVTSSQ